MGAHMRPFVLCMRYMFLQTLLAFYGTQNACGGVDVAMKRIHSRVKSDIKIILCGIFEWYDARFSLSRSLSHISVSMLKEEKKLYSGT